MGEEQQIKKSDFIGRTSFCPSSPTSSGCTCTNNISCLLHIASILLPMLLVPLHLFSQNSPVKWTVQRNWEWLLLVWMAIALYGDKPLIVFVSIYCFSVFNFELYFLWRYCTKIALLCVIGSTLLHLCYRLLATLWKICYRGSEGFGNPLAILL
jgi:hypothetical protein